MGNCAPLGVSKNLLPTRAPAERLEVSSQGFGVHAAEHNMEARAVVVKFTLETGAGILVPCPERIENGSTTAVPERFLELRAAVGALSSPIGSPGRSVARQGAF
jgi:hypothetical protein